MLLYESGVWDDGEGPNFCLDFVRQFTIIDEEDEYMSQLRLSLKYDSVGIEKDLVDFNLWSIDCSNLDDWVKKIKESRAYKRALELKIKDMELFIEDV